MPDVVNEETGTEATGTDAAGGGVTEAGAIGHEAVAGDSADEAVGVDAAGSDAETVARVEKAPEKAPDNEPEEAIDIGAMAAEFVLGTLDSAERSRANKLLESDPHFRGMVRVWERRLGELHLMVEPVDPPPAIWDSIKSKLVSVEQTSQELTPEGQPAKVSTEKTIASLEALEAQLREEGLASTPDAEPAAVEAPPLAAEPVPDEQPQVHREDHPDRPHRLGIGTMLMTLVALGLTCLIAAWRYIPDRLPQSLRAEQVLNIHPPALPPPPARPVAPPESQFDE